MKDIYTDVNEVRIWLGYLEDDIAYRAIEAARRIHDQCIQETNHLNDPPSIYKAKVVVGSNIRTQPFPNLKAVAGMPSASCTRSLDSMVVGCARGSTGTESNTLCVDKRSQSVVLLEPVCL